MEKNEFTSKEIDEALKLFVPPMDQIIHCISQEKGSQFGFNVLCNLHNLISSSVHSVLLSPDTDVDVDDVIDWYVSILKGCIRKSKGLKGDKVNKNTEDSYDLSM
jgi:hypothetical protein